MKTQLLKICTLTLLMFCLQANGQRKEKVTIFDLELKAKDVMGQNKFGGTKEKYFTKITGKNLKEVPSGEYSFLLGTYRNDKNTMEEQDLFNLSTNEMPYRFLDSMDFYYYLDVGFELAAQRNPEIVNDPSFNELKIALDLKKDLVELKKTFRSDKYKKVRRELFLTRYDIIPTPFQVGKRKVTTSTTELKANLALTVDSILKNSTPEIKANVKSYFMSLADEKLDIEGTYIDAKLRESYVKTMDFFISNSSASNIGKDMFSQYLKTYIESPTAAGNSGLVAIQLRGTFDKTKINKDSISATLVGKYNVPIEQAISIGVTASYKFTKDETTTLRSQFSKVYVLRYYTSDKFDALKFKALRIF